VTHYCDGRFRIRSGADVVVGGQTVERDHVTPPSKVLLPPVVFDKLQPGFRALNALIESLERYPVGGMRGITPARMATFAPGWEQAENVLAECRDEVRAIWEDEVVAWNRACWEKISGVDYDFEIARRLAAIRETLDQRYSVEYDIWEPPRPAEATIQDPKIREWLMRGKENAARAVEEALEQFILGPRAAMVQMSQEMVETIQDPKTKVIKPGTFNAWRNAANKLRGLREIADEQLLRVINETEDFLDRVSGEASGGVTSFTAAIKAKGQEIAAAMAAVMTAAQDEAATAEILASFGRAGRVVELD
jgi:hypothetical protein